MDRPTLTLLPATDLARAAFPAPEAILAPILSRGSQCLLYGPPGVGKSLVALGIAHAAATGGSFLGWHAPRPHRVLYLDGYTAPAEMKRRLVLFGTPPASLQFSLSAHDTGEALDLTALENQARLMAGWRRPELVVFDNLASLAGPARRGRTLERAAALPAAAAPAGTGRAAGARRRSRGSAARRRLAPRTCSTSCWRAPAGRLAGTGRRARGDPCREGARPASAPTSVPARADLPAPQSRAPTVARRASALSAGFRLQASERWCSRPEEDQP